MPLQIEDESQEIGHASYYFDSSGHDPSTETYPWLRESFVDTDKDESDLCSICRQLDFNFLFSTPLNQVVADEHIPKPAKLSGGIRLGYASEIQEKSSCAFCALVHTTLCRQQSNGIVPLEHNGQRVVCYLDNIIQGPTRHWLDFVSSPINHCSFTIGLWITTQPDLIEDRLEEPGRSATPTRIQRLCEGVAADHSYCGRAVPASTVDFRLISQWVRACKHQTTCNPQAGRGSPTPARSNFLIRLIDVDRQALVVPNEDPEYVALSYVWGSIKKFTLRSDNFSELQGDGAISPNDPRVPQTIRDAIVVCQNIGERFLWVDSLCIMQDTPDKHRQISQIDTIYQLAKLTIVAAHGADADAGLPGVRLASRPTSQHRVNAQSMRFANILPSLEKLVNSAVWNTRGWTYQERLLSQRKLYFTADQLFFECDHGQFQEDMYTDAHIQRKSESITHDTNSIVYDTDPHYGTDYKIEYRNKINLAVYEEIIFEYTSRNLSHEEDITDAFQGVANLLSHHLFNGSPFVFGIPLCLLDVALLWQSDGPLRRRHRISQKLLMFPSWSWAGWVGRIEFNWYANTSERTLSRVIWLEANESDLPVESEWTGIPKRTWPKWALWKRHVDTGEWVYYTRMDGDGDSWFCHPIPDRVDPQPSPVNSTTGHLRVLAEIAKLAVTGKHSGRWSQNPKCDEGVHEMCELSIFDSDGIRAGILFIDGNTFRRLSAGLHEFIKLSQTTLSHGESDPAWDESTERYSGEPGHLSINPRSPLDAEDEPFDPSCYDLNICWCFYNVLMIEWQDSVAYRVGIGQVHIHAFDNASPQWHKMVLG